MKTILKHANNIQILFYRFARISLFRFFARSHIIARQLLIDILIMYLSFEWSPRLPSKTFARWKQKIIWYRGQNLNIANIEWVLCSLKFHMGNVKHNVQTILSLKYLWKEREIRISSFRWQKDKCRWINFALRNPEIKTQDGTIYSTDFPLRSVFVSFVYNTIFTVWRK